MALIPPHTAEGGQIFRWRLVVAGMLIGNTVALGLHIAISCGYLEPGIHGFATTATVSDIHNQLADLLVGQKAAAVERYRDAQCKAISSKNDAALTIVDPQLQQALRDYQNQTGHQYQLLPCDP